MGKRVTGVWLLLLLLITAIYCTHLRNDVTKPAEGNERALREYGRDWLLSLRRKVTPEPGLLDHVPEELLRQRGGNRPRKRGRRGGIKLRLRRRATRPPLPSILFGNVRSLRNKMEELRLNTKACNEYRESCLMIYTETWLQEDFPDSLVQVRGFSCVRMDRNIDSGKVRGGGICVYINESWCNNYTIKYRVCTPDLELICISLRPFYLPRDYGNIFLCSVYIPPNGNALKAASCVADCAHQQLRDKPDSPIFVLGDFNHCRLELSLPGFQQYVKNSTRKNRTLDKCYGNIKDAYAARIKPPLSNSDHNIIHLIPTFKCAIKKSKPVTKIVSVFQDESKEKLSGCFLATDWDVFYRDNDIDNIAETITGYIHFCVDTVVPKKTIIIYPNNKDYITPEIKHLIKRKKQAFRNNDLMELRLIQKILRRELKRAREEHSKRVREAFLMNNPKKLWDMVKDMTNMKSSMRELNMENDLNKANDLNIFYKRFDLNCETNVTCCKELSMSIPCDPTKDRIIINPKDVTAVFKKLNSKKASGPDGISSFILKTFSDELTPAWCPLFQFSVDTCIIPTIWKTSIVIPLPKKSCPQQNDDYRPVALTSIVMKSLERIMVSKLRSEVQHLLDPYQFAYNNGRGTDDALITTVHSILKHLENPSGYVRLLFMDFSSAFNCILPQIMLSRLQQMEVNPFIVKWYGSFLTERKQQVRVNSTLSDMISVSTGAPQGCVSSPLLFILYTNECRTIGRNNFIIKFSDDTAILSLLYNKSDIGIYIQEIEEMVKWCNKHNLLLNVNKTKEMIFDPRSIGDQSSIIIEGVPIEQVTTYKYLGIQLDKQLQWSNQVEYVSSRVCQRLYFLRKLRVHGVDKDIMLLFYKAAIESIVRYGMVAWFGNLSVKLKSQLQTLIKRAGKIIGRVPPTTLNELFEEAVRKQSLKITNDPNHVLYSEYEMMPSGRRYRLPNCRLNRFKFSFVPLSIKILNKNK